MTAALTPPLALAYLDELSLDVRAAAVLGGDGEALAGDAALAALARALPAAVGVHRAPAAAGETLLLARAPGGAAIAVRAAPGALAGLLEHDLARIAEALVLS